MITDELVESFIQELSDVKCILEAVAYGEVTAEHSNLAKAILEANSNGDSTEHPR